MPRGGGSARPPRSPEDIQPFISASTVAGTSDEAPGPAVPSNNCHFSHVVFNDVKSFYVRGGDLTCCYTLTHKVVPRRKDWVGIFRVGWKTVQEHWTFMWAPLPGTVCSGRDGQQQIQFKAHCLPEDNEYYQFCYVNEDDVVQGASTPFQFRAEPEDDILVVYTQEELGELELENKNLLKENEELKASCASLQKQNTSLQEELKKIQELQNSLESLRSDTNNLELELNCLKREKKCLEDVNEYKKTELHQLREQLRSVTSEKECLETKLKTALDHKDQLQSQVSNYKEEVEKLSRLDRDKTKQLESLKEENQQSYLAQQEQNCTLRKELEKQKRLLQILQARKNEVDEEIKKEREENNKLQKRLSETREFCSISVVSQAQAPIPALRRQGLIFGNPYSGLSVGKDRV